MTNTIINDYSQSNIGIFWDLNAGSYADMMFGYWKSEFVQEYLEHSGRFGENFIKGTLRILSYIIAELAPDLIEGYALMFGLEVVE